MIELITVVFEKEIPLIKIQANSIAQYIDSGDIERITVVVNDVDAVCELIDVAWYKQNAHKVRIIARSQWGYTNRMTGWEGQQLCKLLAASESVSQWSMVLDAKTWFVKRLNLALLFDEAERPRVGLSTVNEHFVTGVKFIEQLYNVDLAQVIGPSGVPFMFHTETVQALVNSVADFAEFFQTNVRHPNFISEFHLYSGYFLWRHKDYNKHYNPKSYYSYRNISEWEADNFDFIFGEVSGAYRPLTASVHIRAYKKLSPTQVAQWCKFLYDSKIIDNEQETLALLNTL